MKIRCLRISCQTLRYLILVICGWHASAVSPPDRAPLEPDVPRGGARVRRGSRRNRRPLPVWLILLNLKLHKPANQRELAEAVGVREATLTHHLNAMDTRGLITRTRDAANRRVQVVTLTETGEAAFMRLRHTAIAFDARLRAGLTEADLATLSTLLGRLAANVGAPKAAPPWAGAAERRRD